MHLDIRRYASTDSGTLSRVSVYPDASSSGEPAAVFYGIEQPWRNNQANVSCIPDGDYTLEPHSSEKYGQVWAFVGAKVSHYPEAGVERSACLIHRGNYASDVKGCLALGLEATVRGGSRLPMVTNSGIAITRLRELASPSIKHTCRISWEQVS